MENLSLHDLSEGLLVKSGVGGIEPPYYEQCTFLTLTSFHPISLKIFTNPESCRISFEHIVC